MDITNLNHYPDKEYPIIIGLPHDESVEIEADVRNLFNRELLAYPFYLTDPLYFQAVGIEVKYAFSTGSPAEIDEDNGTIFPVLGEALVLFLENGKFMVIRGDVSFYQKKEVKREFPFVGFGMAHSLASVLELGSMVDTFPKVIKGRKNPNPYGKPVLVRTTPKVGRNKPCTCGSGRKYKHCCLNKKE